MYIDVLNKIHPCRNYVYFDPNSFKILRITILLLTFAPNGAYTPPSPLNPFQKYQDSKEILVIGGDTL